MGNAFLVSVLAGGVFFAVAILWKLSKRSPLEARRLRPAEDLIASSELTFVGFSTTIGLLAAYERVPSLLKPVDAALLLGLKPLEVLATLVVLQFLFVVTANVIDQRQARRRAIFNACHTAAQAAASAVLGTMPSLIELSEQEEELTKDKVEVQVGQAALQAVVLVANVYAPPHDAGEEDGIDDGVRVVNEVFHTTAFYKLYGQPSRPAFRDAGMFIARNLPGLLSIIVPAFVLLMGTLA